MTGVVAALIGGGGVGVDLSTYSLSATNSVAPVVTAPVTATVNGGVAASFFWTRTDGGSQPITIDNLTSATTTISSSPPPGQTYNGVFVCTAIVAGSSVESPPLAVEITRT